MGATRRALRSRRFSGITEEVVYAFTIDAVTPSSNPVSAVDVPVALTTTGAPAGVVVYLNGVAYPANTSWVSAVLTNIVVPAALLLVPGSVSIRLVQGASTSNSVSLTVLAAVPTLTSVSPARYDFNDAPGTTRTFTLTGTNFYNNPSYTQVYLNGSVVTHTWVSSTSITVDVNDSTAQQLDFYVFNSPPGGGASATQTSRINYPVPVVASVAPTSTPLNSGNVGITVTGTGGTFRLGSIATCDGVDLVTTPVDSNHVNATVPSTVTAVTGTKALRVRNPTTASGGGVSAASAAFDVGFPVPVLTSISPTKLRWNDPASAVTCSGSLMTTSTVARVGGVNQVTNTAGQPSSVSFTYTPSTVGEYNIDVTNPGVAASMAQVLAIVPVITSMSPNTGIQYDPATVGSTVTGSGFTASTVIEINGIDCPTTYVNSTTVTITIPGTVSINPGAQTVRAKRATGAPTSIDSITYTVATYDPLVTATGNYASYDADHVTLDTPFFPTDVVGLDDIVGGVGPYINTTTVPRNPVLIASDSSLNNYASIDLNGTNEYLGSAVGTAPLVTSLLPAGDFTIAFIFYARSSTTNAQTAATVATNHQIWASNQSPGARCGLALLDTGGGTAGLIFWMYDGAFKMTPLSTNFSFGAWAYCIVTKSGTNLSISVRGEANKTTASVNNISSTTQRTFVGVNSGSSKYYDGKFRAMIFGLWVANDIARFQNYCLYRLGIT